MTAAEALAALKAHLAKRGFGDIEVNMTGGYDPNSTAANAGLIRAQTVVYRRGGSTRRVARSAGSWPGYVFTGTRCAYPRAISARPWQRGARAERVLRGRLEESAGARHDGAVRSYVDYLFELARTS